MSDALRKALAAIAEGYEVNVLGDDQHIRVRNPKYQPDNGSDPWLVIDIFSALASAPAPVGEIVAWLRDYVAPRYGTHAAAFTAIADAISARWGGGKSGAQPAESAPYDQRVLAWLHLPKNPPASGWVIASRCYVQEDEPEYYAEVRRTVGCWWANGMYYPRGHVTHWLPLPPEDGR